MKGIPALACLAAGAGAGMMSLVSSFFDVGAIEMMMMQVLGRCSMLQHVAVCCSVVQCAVAGMMSLVPAFCDVGAIDMMMMQVLECCSVLQCVAVGCNVLRGVAVCSLYDVGGIEMI